MALNKDTTKRLVLSFPKDRLDDVEKVTQIGGFDSQSKMMKQAILEFIEKVLSSQDSE